jgi:hypothetical protein
MQPRQHRVHGVVDRGALGGVGLRHVRLPDDAARDVVHDVERRANDAFILAVDERRSDRKALRVERGNDPELAIDRVRRRQQLARRLASQHAAPRASFEQISRVRLPALELPHRQRAFETGQAGGEKGAESRDIERERGRDLLGAGKCRLAIDRSHHCGPTRLVTRASRRESVPRCRMRQL